MNVYSQNGWEANDRSLVSTRPVPGTNVVFTLRNGAAGDLLIAVAERFNREVEPLDGQVMDDWSYAERPIRGGVALSNHSSGTAVDLNATKHPMGTPPGATFSRAQIVAIHRIIAATGDVVRWGGDYIGRPDPMHWEINDGRTEADCARALLELGGASAARMLRRGSRGEAVRALQARLNRDYPLYSNLVVDGVFGPATEAVVREFQERARLVVDGIAGPVTLGRLGL